LMEKMYFSRRSKLEKFKECQHEVSHMLFLCEKPRRFSIPNKTKKACFNTKKYPINRKQWIYHFTKINEVLEEALSEEGVWIVADSKAILKLILSQYYVTQGKTMLEAVSTVPYVHHTALSEELFLQLQLWNAMGAKIDDNFELWEEYKDQFTKEEHLQSPVVRINPSSIVNNKQRLERVKKMRDENKLKLQCLPTTGDQNWGYCCKFCKTRLLTSSNILRHNATTLYQPVLSEEYPCTQISVEPLRWMDNILLDRGSLFCYSCASEIGCWDWESLKNCPQCTETFASNFLLRVSSIIFVSPPNIRESKRPRNVRSANLWSLLTSARQASGQDKKKAKSKSKSKSRNSEHHVHVVATQVEELPKQYQKEITRARVPFALCNENWYVTKQVFVFISKVYIYSREPNCAKHPDSEEEFNCLSYLKSLVRGITEFSKGTKFEKHVVRLKEEAKDVNVRRPLDHPLIMGYIKYSDNDWKECTVPYTNIRVPNYVDLGTITFLNSADPRDVFKIENRSSGKGGYGKVYIAKYLETGKKVAIKKMEHTGDHTMSKNLKEVAILTAASHPNVVKYYDCYNVGDELWLAMELLQGGTLNEIQYLKSFNETRVAFVARECLNALKHLHELGLCHRDIKPSNIMLTNDATVKIIDFGLCETAQTVAEAPKLSGSPYWLAPETLLMAPQTGKSDIWSLGCTLLQLIDPNAFMMGSSFRTLFMVGKDGRAESIDIISKRPGKLALTSEFMNFIRAMLHRDPRKRSTAAELLEHPFITTKDLSPQCLQGVVNQLLISKEVFK